MKVSARNQLKGVIADVKEGAVNAVVTIELGDHIVKCDITIEAVHALQLEPGKPAYAIIKASHVIIAAGFEPLSKISARNQFVGIIKKITKGAVNGHVALEMSDGNIITASITNEAIESLELKEGGNAVAIIKASDVMVAID